MKIKYPRISGYCILKDAISRKIPFEQSIRSFAPVCDEIIVFDFQSQDGTYERLREIMNDYAPKMIVYLSSEKWDSSRPDMFGYAKNIARSKCTGDWCLQFDGDEFLHEKDYDKILNLPLKYPDAKVLDFLVFTPFGEYNKFGIFKGSENYWKWRLTKNIPEIQHGVHGAARQYDINGNMFFSKEKSDSCEYIDKNTLQVMSHAPVFNPNIEIIYQQLLNNPNDRNLRNKFSVMFSNLIKENICVFHYSWFDFERKAENGINFWSNSYASKNNLGEHSNLFQGTSKEELIEKWKKLPVVDLLVDLYPKNWSEQIKRKPIIVNISLDRNNDAGVTRWGKELEKLISNNYEFRWFAFNDYATGQSADESAKAKEFSTFLDKKGYLDGAKVIFADGFWGCGIPNDKPVISVIHGLWSDPERNKWEDGLSHIRTKLLDAQIKYWTETKHRRICVSNFIQKRLKEKYNINSELLSNGIDYDDFARASMSDKVLDFKYDKPIVIHGVTDYNKGTDIIIKLLDKADKDNIELIKIDEAKHKFGLSKEEVFAVANLVFMPSKWEANSYLLLEALVAQKPIVAYNCGILREHKEDWNNLGKVVELYDADIMWIAIKEVLARPKSNFSINDFLTKNQYSLGQWRKHIMKLIGEYV